jgi:tRNA uridine 5-carbamoylmethylation protein Kti12
MNNEARLGSTATMRRKSASLSVVRTTRGSVRNDTAVHQSDERYKNPKQSQRWDRDCQHSHDEDPGSKSYQFTCDSKVCRPPRGVALERRRQAYPHDEVPREALSTRQQTCDENHETRHYQEKSRH